METSSGEGRFPPKCAQSSLIVDGQAKPHAFLQCKIRSSNYYWQRDEETPLYWSARCIVLYVLMQRMEKKPEHERFKNWSGLPSSMETNILLEGFCQAEHQHGVP